MDEGDCDCEIDCCRDEVLYCEVCELYGVVYGLFGGV